MMSQILSIIIINILKYKMKIFMKYFLVGNLNLCYILNNIMRKIVETYNLNFRTMIAIIFNLFSHNCVIFFFPLFYLF